MTTPAEIITPPSPPSLVFEPPISAASIEGDNDTDNNDIYESESMVSSQYDPYAARQEKEGERPVWSSRYAYTCGALLSLPLSQLWRGAALLSGSTSVYASLIGLVLAICVIGLPLYVLELGWGQKYQVGAVGIWQLPHFGKRKRRWTGLGVCGTILGLVYACYTIGILSWTLHALVDTFILTPEEDSNNPWTTSLALSSSFSNSQEDDTMRSSQSDPFLNRQQAVEAYWVDTVVGQATLMIDDGDTTGLPTRFLLDNLVYIAILWGIVGAISSCGIRFLGRITLVTTSVSLLLLIALFAASLMVSYDTITENLASSSTWEDFATAIDQDDVLSESIVQTLYLTSILVGVQSAYASYGPTGQAAEPIAKIACLVMGINILLIFTTGYVISTAIPSEMPYYQLTNMTWNSSLRLVFAYWPAALSTLSGGLIWVRLLYAVLLLLGIQLPLAVMTAILTVLRDDRASTVARWKVAGLATVVGFAATVVFATDAGLVFLDTIDYYLTLSLLLVAFLEAFAAGWMYDMEDQIRTYGILPTIFSMLWNFSPVVVAAGVWFGLGNNAEAADHHHRMWLGLFGGLIAFLFFFMLAFVSIRYSYERYVAQSVNAASSNDRILHPRDYYLDFSFGNVEALKQNLQSSMGGNLPQIWYIFLKRVVPHLLLLVFLKRLFMILVIPLPNDDNQYLTNMAFGGYGGYPMLPYQVAGMTLFGLVVALFLLGFVCPTVYTPLVPPPTSVFINRRDTLEDEDDIEDPTGEESESEVNMDELQNMEDPVEVMGGRAYRVDIQ